MRIAIVGSGVSGIAAAKTLGRLGHDVTLFEKSDQVGGVWAVAYPGVHLQVMSELYCYPDFPWPFKHDEYPSAAEVLRYIHAAMTVVDGELSLDPLPQSWEGVAIVAMSEGFFASLNAGAAEELPITRQASHAPAAPDAPIARTRSS